MKTPEWLTLGIHGGDIFLRQTDNLYCFGSDGKSRDLLSFIARVSKKALGYQQQAGLKMWGPWVLTGTQHFS